MKIRSFPSTLNFAIATLNEDRAEDSINFEKNFDTIMEQAAAYIRKIVEDNYDGDDISASELNEIILEDYNRLADECYQNTDISLISMKYLAVKYLTKHRNEIPELLREIEERKLEYTETVAYTDDFHENVLLALLAIQYDYDQYYENMKQKNSTFLDEIQELVEQNGKIDGFKKYCDKYSSYKGIPFSSRRQFLLYGYLTIFGLEGIDETSLPEKSPVMKYKTSNQLKDYVNNYLERLEPMYREDLENSIISIFCQLDRFGEIVENVEYHNDKMRRIGLPGLGYSLDETKVLPGDVTLPKVQDLINKSALSKLDIDVLLRMNSFYNNRLAKVISEYSMAVFVLDNLNATKSAYDGMPLKKSSVGEETLEQLMIKYKTLILPIKSFFAKTQREIEENPDGFNEYVQDVPIQDAEPGSKKQIVLELDDFIDDVKKSWKSDYTEHFNQMLPNVENNLRQDIFLINRLYNPVFLSYTFKNRALQSEYAYLHHLSQIQSDKSLNFGVVLRNDSDWEKRTILLASDGGVNLPNRLHTINRGFVDFLTSYTGKPLARVYEGFNDFFVGGEYISSQLLLPVSKQHTKYLKDLKRGKLAERGDKTSRVTMLNEKFIEHINYCADSSNFMKSYTVPVNRVDKKGKVFVENVQPVRYVDLTDGKIYTQKEDGKLVDKNGNFYGEDPEEVRGIDE